VGEGESVLEDEQTIDFDADPADPEASAADLTSTSFSKTAGASGVNSSNVAEASAVNNGPAEA
jgi:hypothetical protein